MISEPNESTDVELDDPTEEPTETTGVDEITQSVESTGVGGGGGGGEEHDDTDDSNGPVTESKCFKHTQEISRTWAHENDSTQWSLSLLDLMCQTY